MSDKYEQSGYVTIISVIIIGAIAASVAVSLLTGGIDAAKNSLSVTRLAQARVLADACAEEALQNIRDTSYIGTFNLSFPAGTCSSTVVSLGSPNFIITALGSSTDAIKKVRITINQLTPKITISSWSEVSDF